MTAITLEQVQTAVANAREAARAAGQAYLNQHGDRDACGFAWVNIYGVKGSTKLGKTLTAAGVRKDYTGAFQIWNPSGLGCQSISVLEAGADAAAKVLKEQLGLEQVYAGSRMD